MVDTLKQTLLDELRAISSADELVHRLARLEEHHPVVRFSFDEAWEEADADELGRSHHSTPNRRFRNGWCTVIGLSSYDGVGMVLPVGVDFSPPQFGRGTFYLLIAVQGVRKPQKIFLKDLTSLRSFSVEAL